VDEDGEILDVEEFEALQMARELKAEGMALWVLDLRDEQNAVKAEIARLQARLKAAERKQERLLLFLQTVLRGEKLKTSLISVSYRRTEAVEISDEEAVRAFAQKDERYEDILRYKEPEISKSEIKRLISEGVAVPGAAIASRISTVIK
jgi:hypothetical protein